MKQDVGYDYDEGYKTATEEMRNKWKTVREILEKSQQGETHAL